MRLESRCDRTKGTCRIQIGSDGRRAHRIFEWCRVANSHTEHETGNVLGKCPCGLHPDASLIGVTVRIPRCLDPELRKRPEKPSRTETKCELSTDTGRPHVEMTVAQWLKEFSLTLLEMKNVKASSGQIRPAPGKSTWTDQFTRSPVHRCGNVSKTSSLRLRRNTDGRSGTSRQQL